MNEIEKILGLPHCFPQKLPKLSETHPNVEDMHISLPSIFSENYKSNTVTLYTHLRLNTYDN